MNTKNRQTITTWVKLNTTTWKTSKMVNIWENITEIPVKNKYIDAMMKSSFLDKMKYQTLATFKNNQVDKASTKASIPSYGICPYV